jgi:hypothetical protein
MPLRLGNAWYYDQIRGSDTVGHIWMRVSNVRKLGGRDFYLTTSTYLGSDTSFDHIDSTYYYQKGDSLFQIVPRLPFEESSVTLLAVWNMERGTHFVTRWRDIGYLCSVLERSDSTISFLYETTENIADLDFSETFQRNVGLKDIHGSWGYRLVLKRYEFP